MRGLLMQVHHFVCFVYFLGFELNFFLLDLWAEFQRKHQG